MYELSYFTPGDDSEPIQFTECYDLQTEGILNAWCNHAFGIEYDEYVDNLFLEGYDVEEEGNIEVEHTEDCIKVTVHHQSIVCILVVTDTED